MALNILLFAVSSSFNWYTGMKMSKRARNNPLPYLVKRRSPWILLESLRRKAPSWEVHVNVPWAFPETKNYAKSCESLISKKNRNHTSLWSAFCWSANLDLLSLPAEGEHSSVQLRNINWWVLKSVARTLRSSSYSTVSLLHNGNCTQGRISNPLTFEARLFEEYLNLLIIVANFLKKSRILFPQLLHCT